MTGRKAQAQAEQVAKPEKKEAEDLHRMVAGIREQMEYMLREQFAVVEAAVQERLKDRDARIVAAEALIARLQQETAEREAKERQEAKEKLAAAEALIARLQQEAVEQRAEAERQAEKMAKLRQLALESS